MKTYLLTLGVLGLLTGMAQAQDDSKLRRDVTYSTGNYKHPNKAAAARQWSAKQGVSVTAPGTIAGPIANYKQPMSGSLPSSGITTPHTPETDVAVRNYKIQRVSEPQPTQQSVATDVKNTPNTNGND